MEGYATFETFCKTKKYHASTLNIPAGFRQVQTCSRNCYLLALETKSVKDDIIISF